MTETQVMRHLQVRLPDFSPSADPEVLTGGLLNQVWRVRGAPFSIVVKHAAPHIASAPDIPLDSSRLLFEGRALSILDRGGALGAVASHAVRSPRLLDVDPTRCVLIMEDVSPADDLGAVLRTGRSLAGVGEQLGAFVGKLHCASWQDASCAREFDNRPIQETRLNLQYRAVQAFCDAAGASDAAELGKRAADLGAFFLRRGRCLIQGDLWPPSILLSPAGLRIIDWEFSHFGQPEQDVAHLAAHLWMHAYRAHGSATEFSSRLLLGAFLRSYRATVTQAGVPLITEGFLTRCSVHFGAELLMRSIGPFRDGYLYDGLTLDDQPLKHAVAVGMGHLRSPTSTTTFDALDS